MRKRELSVNIGQLEHVVEVIRFSSFALAAKARHASPQALSKAVSDLERELGVKLFERTGRSIEATPFAREFEKRARHILFEQEMALGVGRYGFPCGNRKSPDCLPSRH